MLKVMALLKIRKLARKAKVIWNARAEQTEPVSKENNFIKTQYKSGSKKNMLSN